MVGEGMGRILKKEGKYFLRIPKDVAEDSMFPFIVGEKVKVSFEIKDIKKFIKDDKFTVKKIDKKEVKESE